MIYVSDRIFYLNVSEFKKSMFLGKKTLYMIWLFYRWLEMSANRDYEVESWCGTFGVSPVNSSALNQNYQDSAEDHH